MNELLIEIAGGIIVGASLGLIGAGGAILSVPIFVVFLKHEAKDAVAEALLVTFAVALVSAVRAAMVRQVSWRRVLLVGVPGVVGAYVGGLSAHLLSDPVQIGIFWLVALVAAWKMALPQSSDDSGPSPAGNSTPNGTPQDATPLSRTAAVEAALIGLGIGLLTGLVGVGGGFLLVPALLLLMKLPMRVAVGTSLAIIALNSVCGFVGNRLGDPTDVHPDWKAVSVVAAFGIVGSLVGARVAARLPRLVLRRTFACIIMLAACLTAAKQFWG